MSDQTTKQTIPVDWISPDGTPLPQLTPPVAPTKPAEPIAPKVEAPVETPVVETPAEETPEAEAEDTVVDFSKFLEAKADSDKQIALKQKPEEKPVEPAKEDAQQKTTIDPALATKKQYPAERDYSEIPEEDREIFTKMSNAAFEKLKPVYLAHKKNAEVLAQKDQEIEKLKKAPPVIQRQDGLPENYYTHPEAYTLTPEYKQKSNDVNLAQQILNHWSNELNNVRQGAKEINVLGLNPQTGQLYIAQKIPADVNSENALLQQFNASQMQMMNAQASLQAVQKVHSEKHSQAMQTLQQFEKAVFAKFDEPDMKPIYDPVIKQAMDNVHPAFRNDPLLPAFAKSMVLNQVLGKLLNEAQSKLSQQTTTQVAAPTKVNKTKQNAGPTAAEAASEGGETSKRGKGEDVTADDFEKVKSGY